jgi:hypothetical protein
MDKIPVQIGNFVVVHAFNHPPSPILGPFIYSLHIVRIKISPGDNPKMGNSGFFKKLHDNPMWFKFLNANHSSIRYCYMKQLVSPLRYLCIETFSPCQKTW